MNQVDQQNQETDYDPFASVRPKRMIEEPKPVKEVKQDKFSEVRAKNQIGQQKPEPQESTQERISRGAKDVGKQFTKEAVIGAGGAIGDIGEAIGSLLPESPITAGRRKLKENLISKAEKENRDLSEGEAYLVEQADKAILSVPTSKDLRKLNKELGGIGEAQTPEGKYAGRAGKLVGSTVPFTGGAIRPILSAAAAGLAGQGAEDLGFGPLTQAAVEIAVMLKTGGKSPSEVSSSNKAAQQEIEQLRKLGYAEEDITLAINRASGGKFAGVSGSKSEKTEAAFKNFTQHSDDLVDEILTSGIPGYERGPQYVHELASNAYGHVVDQAKNLKITKVESFFDSVDSAIKEVRRNLGNSKEAKEFIERLTQAGLDAVEKPNADAFISFYKELNGLGKWMGRSQKDRIITNVKNSIKDTFKSEGKEGARIAEEFEKVNTGIQKAYKAEEIHHLIERTRTQNGMDYKKFNKIFDSADNVELFREVLGPQQAENLTRISKLGKEVGDFDKAWKAATKGFTSKLVDKAAWKYFLYNMDFKGLAISLGGKVADVGTRKLIEKSLTDPKFQNLLTHGLHALKNQAPRLLKSANEGIDKYLEEQGIEINP